MRYAQFAMAQHRHAKHCVAAGLLLTLCRTCQRKADAGIAVASQLLAADLNIVRIDVDADDFRLRKIAPQAEHFFTGRTTERQDAGGVAVRHTVADARKNAGMPVEGSPCVR